MDDEYFPVDKEGNRADVIMDPNSTFSRMNISRFYEQYFNGASRHVHNYVCNHFNVKPYVDSSIALSTISNSSQKLIDDMYNYVLNYYKIVSPKMYGWFESGKISYSKEEYLSEIIANGVYLYIPTDNSPDTTDIVTTLETLPQYKQVHGPVTYLGDSGNYVTTLENVRIAPVYMILLEKIGDTWSAVSSGKLQHFGVLSQLTKNDKFNKPSRNQAVRGAGEAEVRIFISYIGSEFVVEMMDRNNNPTTHKHIVQKILSADKPTNIDNLVDRNLIPFGGNKPVQLVNHILQVAGIKFEYTPHQPYIQNVQYGESK